MNKPNICPVCGGDLNFDVEQDELEVESSPCICEQDRPSFGPCSICGKPAYHSVNDFGQDLTIHDYVDYVIIDSNLFCDEHVREPYFWTGL